MSLNHCEQGSFIFQQYFIFLRSIKAYDKLNMINQSAAWQNCQAFLMCLKVQGEGSIPFRHTYLLHVYSKKEVIFSRNN